MDDFCLCGNNKGQLWEWKRAITERLGRLRLRMHESTAQVFPATNGVPWLGFVVFPTHRRVKARKVRLATRRLCERLDDYHDGRISFGELDASVRGWINHVQYADTWGLRKHLFGQPWFRIRPRSSTRDDESLLSERRCRSRDQSCL